MKISLRASLSILSLAVIAFILGAVAYKLALSGTSLPAPVSSVPSGWKAYASPSFSFQFMYPPEASINPQKSSADWVTIEGIPFLVFPKDGAQKRFEVSVQPLGNSYCDTDRNPIIIPKVLTIRGGTTFMSDSWQYSVGTQVWDMSETYHAVRNNLCYAMHLNIIGPYGETVPWVTYAISEEEDILEQIAATFQFVR